MPRSFSIRRNTKRHPNASHTSGKGLIQLNLLSGVIGKVTVATLTLIALVRAEAVLY